MFRQGPVGRPSAGAEREVEPSVGPERLDGPGHEEREALDGVGGVAEDGVVGAPVLGGEGLTQVVGGDSDAFGAEQGDQIGVDLEDLGREVRSQGFTGLKTNIFLFDPKPDMFQPGFTRGTGWPELNWDKPLIRGLRAQLEAMLPTDFSITSLGFRGVSSVFVLEAPQGRRTDLLGMLQNRIGTSTGGLPPLILEGFTPNGAPLFVAIDTETPSGDNTSTSIFP